MKKLIALTSLILAVSLFAEPGENKGQLKRSMKVVPLSSTYLSIENGGTNHASAALSDGIGIYTTQEDEYARAISYLNGKYGDNALKDEKSLKEYTLNNGTPEDRELANKLNLGTAQKSNPGDSCDDRNPQTENDIYLDENFTCEGKKIYYDNKCEGDPIGSEFEFEGETYLVVDNTTIKNNLNRAETLCTSNVTNMSNLFNGDSSFNQPIGDWDTSKVTTMDGLFFEAMNFNQPLSKWDTSRVTNMAYMFYDAYNFNQDIGNWDVSKVENMSEMFSEAENFNSPLNSWDVSNVTEMRHMFSNANSFNQPLGNWVVSNVEDMEGVFYGAKAFNQNIGNWDVSKVMTMNSMFSYAIKFDQDISNWDISNVINMNLMFSNTINFNKDISKWVVSNIEDMNGMFYNAKAFNQNISSWDVSNVEYYEDFAINSALTSANAPAKNGTKFPTTK